LWGDGIGGCEERRMDDSVSRVSPDEVAQVNGESFGEYSLFRKFKKSCAGAGGRWAKKGLGGRAAYQRQAGAAPSPCRRAAPSGSGSRGGEARLMAEMATRSAVPTRWPAKLIKVAPRSAGQQSEDIGVVVLRRRHESRAAARAHVVHGGVGSACEYHPHDVRVPVCSRHHEGRALVVGGLEASPAQVESRAARRQ